MSFNRPIVDQIILDVGAEAFGRLAKLFMDETVVEIDAIEALAADMRNLGELGRRAHSLKNAAGSFGLASLAAVARELETACDSANAPEVARSASRLRGAWLTGRPALHNLVDEISQRPGGQP